MVKLRSRYANITIPREHRYCIEIKRNLFMKILIVDDEFVSRKKMHKIVQNFGKCKVVDSGKAAISAFKTAWESWTPFDLITLDVSMPEMDGIEVVYKIREIEKENKVGAGGKASKNIDGNFPFRQRYDCQLCSSRM